MVRESMKINYSELENFYDHLIMLLDSGLPLPKGIRRFGHAVTPMDESMSSVTVDLSNRPYLVFNVPSSLTQSGNSLTCLVKEFFRALTTRGGMNLHVNVAYGENEHHIIESVFKSMGRALHEATRIDPRVIEVRSSKGIF